MLQRYSTRHCPGKVVRWGAFSSSSFDQGVGVAFADSANAGDDGLNANVFTLWGRSGRDISLWSRLSRERELLYSANTLWQITSALTEEQRQLLG